MEKPRKSFFDRLDWQAFWCCFGVAFGVYFCSLGPSVGLEDAGELATAAQVLGVPHPPGYPLWTMVSWLFCRLFGCVTWQGYPNPAWAVSLFSALSGAVAAGLTALLAVRSGRDALHALSDAPEAPDSRLSWCAWWGGVTGSLCFAFSPVMWSQAVIVEVYALGALFMALVMTLTYRWLQAPSGRVLVWLGLVFGLGLTNYQVLLLAALPIALVIVLRHRSLAFSFLSVGIPFGLTVYGLMLGALPSADLYSTPGAPVILRPETAFGPEPLLALAPGWFYIVLAAAVLHVVVALWMNRSRVWTGGAIAGVVLLLLIAECAWSASTLPSGFQGTLYPFIKAWLIHLVGLGAVWAMGWRSPTARRFALAVTVVQLTFLILLQQGLMLGLEHPTTWWFWWGIVWNGLLLTLAWKWLPEGRHVAGTLLAAEAGVSVYAYMPLVSDCLNPAMNWGYARTWEGFKHAISRGQYEAIAPATFFSKRYLLQVWSYVEDLRLQFSLPVVLLAVGGTATAVVQVVRKKRRHVLIWVVSTFLFFGVMSALLVALANPSGDLQDGFIQKVKFISSHGVFALWVAYGLTVCLVLAVKRWGKAGLRWACLLACVVAAVPLIENARNDELIHRMGCAEQTGHDYGWQFGAYMLEGAKAILPELSEDEEPLPDPFYPPPMEPHAIFFGGTDPGRFVPTYMVEAIGYRSDLFVLTQNALADPTYMNVERDLYGDAIWLPTADQVRDAFVNYVDDVQAGKRTTRGEIVEENGRMRITGSSAVMDINDALAQQIVEHNDNPVYVEESYAIQWMYPLLEPAGLAMRLRREPNAAWGDLAQRDSDFWDWMTRRLTSQRAYRRDFAAKKSFSKLRSSIAGLYANRKDFTAAEDAFYDALRLYPTSSESVFRSIQEFYLPMAQLDGACRLLHNYHAADPKNARVKRLQGRLAVLKETYAIYERLSHKATTGTITTAEQGELASVCEALGLKTRAIELWQAVAAAPNVSAEEACEGAIALQRLRSFDTALVLLKRIPAESRRTLTETELVASAGLAQTYGENALALAFYRVALEQAPTSGRVWLGVALYYYGIGNEAQAYDCMCTAVRYGASALIEDDAAVAAVFLRLMRRYGTPKGGM